jgi:hypothetical protein
VQDHFEGLRQIRDNLPQMMARWPVGRLETDLMKNREIIITTQLLIY